MTLSWKYAILLDFRQAEQYYPPAVDQTTVDHQPINMSYGRHWCFTSFETQKPVWDRDLMEYLCYGKETCPTTNKEHWQSYVIWKKKARMPKLKSSFGETVHCEIAKGSPPQNRRYCMKDGVFEEHGKCPGDPQSERAKKKWADTRRRARLGEFDEIADEHYIRYHAAIKRIREEHVLQAKIAKDLPEGFLTGIWIHGAPGVGKSHWVREQCKENDLELYVKDMTKWWDGYHGEPIVILDDVDYGSTSLSNKLKIWADRYAFPAEVKGGTTRIRPVLFIVTSNYTPGDIFPDGSLSVAILRRFRVWHFQTREDQEAHTIHECFNGFPEVHPKKIKTEKEIIEILSSDEETDAPTPGPSH